MLDPDIKGKRNTHSMEFLQTRTQDLRNHGQASSGSPLSPASLCSLDLGRRQGFWTYMFSFGCTIHSIPGSLMFHKHKDTRVHVDTSGACRELAVLMEKPNTGSAFPR